MRLFEVIAPTLVVKPPAACRPKELDAFCALVASGGEVASSGLRARVTAAHVLAFLWSQSSLVGVAALKQPRSAYRDAVFAKAGAPDAERYRDELGWLIVAAPYRGQGFSEQLIRGALKAVSSGVFATSAAQNTVTARLIQKVGFLPAGRPYRGASGRDLILYLRP